MLRITMTRRKIAVLLALLAPLPLSGQEPIRIRQQARFELTGDMETETITVAADGPDWQSLDVRMEIMSEDGRSLYRYEWTSDYYFLRSPPGSPEAQEQTVRQSIADIVGNQAAYQDRLRRAGHPLDSAQETRVAIEWDLMEQTLGELIEDNVTPAEYAQRLRAARRALSPEDGARFEARVDALFGELETQPRYFYRAWSENYFGLSWSDAEDRFVRIYMCC